MLDFGGASTSPHYYCASQPSVFRRVAAVCYLDAASDREEQEYEPRRCTAERHRNRQAAGVLWYGTMKVIRDGLLLMGDKGISQ